MFVVLMGAVMAVDVKLSPSKSLPGTAQAEQVVNGLAFLALVVCLGATVVGGATWAISSWSNNSHYASKGKSGTFVALGGAFVVAAAAALVNWATGLGGAVR